MTTEGTVQSRISNMFRQKHLLWLVLFFVLSRILLYQFFPFRFNRINDFMQFLDPALLQGDLLDALWHLHVQPPLHNLLIGLVLKLVPTGLQAHVLAFLYVLLAFGVILGLYWLLVHRDVRPAIAFGVSTFFSIFPPFIWAERLPAYVLPIMFSLVMMTITLQRYIETRRLFFGATFLLLAIYLPLTRSFFHLIIWMAPVILGFLFVVWKIDRRHLLRYSAIAFFGFTLVASFYLKNVLEYGSLSGSTWQGMNLAGLVMYVPKEKIQEMVKNDEITPLALIPRLSPPSVYYHYYDRSPLHEHSALDNTIKSTGYINWNNRIYAEAAREYQHNTFTIARTYPLYTLLAITNQAYIFCGLSGYRYFNRPDRWWIPRTDTPFHFLFDVLNIYLLPLLFFLLIAIALLNFVRTFRQANQRLKSAAAIDPLLVTNLFIGGTVLYVIVIACFAELGEGHLMRIQIDPLLAVTAGLLVERSIRWKAGRRNL